MRILDLGAASKIAKELAGFFMSQQRNSRFADLHENGLPEDETARRFHASYNTRRGLPPKKMQHDFLSPEDIARLVENPFDEALVRLGFERASHKTWMRRDLAPICHLFTLSRYGSGGWGITPSFGLSLDFVPHIAAGKIRWHRTVKTARFDLRVDTQSRWIGTNNLGPEHDISKLF